MGWDIEPAGGEATAATHRLLIQLTKPFLFVATPSLLILPPHPQDQKTGKIPLLSYLLFFPFHIPTILYTYIHTVLGLTHGVKYGDDVLSGEGYWVGGRYAHKIKDGPSRWEVTVDLTSEFPEMCISTTGIYVNSPVWDGTPPTIENIERCAEAISRGWRGSKKKVGRGGDVMIHCAHGRGRRCLIACAGLVKSGRASDWREGFEIVQRGRRVCKLNQGMRDALERWQKKYVK